MSGFGYNLVLLVRIRLGLGSTNSWFWFFMGFVDSKKNVEYRQPYLCKACLSVGQCRPN